MPAATGAVDGCGEDGTTGVTAGSCMSMRDTLASSIVGKAPRMISRAAGAGSVPA